MNYNLNQILDEININGYFSKKNDNFKEELFKQLKSNFSFLMRNTEINDMDYIIETFNLQTSENVKQNITELITYLNTKNNKNISVEKNILKKHQFNDAIKLFNKLSNHKTNKTNKTNIENQINNNEIPEKINFDKFLEERKNQLQEFTTNNNQVTEKQTEENQTNINDLLNNEVMEEKTEENQTNINDLLNNEVIENQTSMNDLLNNELIEKQTEEKQTNINDLLNNEATEEIEKLLLSMDTDTETNIVETEIVNKTNNKQTKIKKPITLAVSSEDRNIDQYPEPNNFVVVFENPFVFKEISLEKVILPVLNDKEDTIEDYPYLLLDIKELGSNYKSLNKYVNRCFAKLILDKKIGNYKTNTEPIIKKQFTKKKQIKQLSITIRKPNGKIYNFGKTIITYKNKKDNNIIPYTKKNKKIRKKIKPELTFDFKLII